MHKGSCHCGNMKFEVEGELTQVVSCNCSICARKGALLWSVPRIRMVLPVTSTASPAGTVPPRSSISWLAKSTRKAAQQAPQRRQGWSGTDGGMGGSTRAAAV